jgi:hypothetical protein
MIPTKTFGRSCFGPGSRAVGRAAGRGLRAQIKCSAVNAEPPIAMANDLLHSLRKCPDRRLSAVSQPHLFEDGLEMAADGALGELEGQLAEEYELKLAILLARRSYNSAISSIVRRASTSLGFVAVLLRTGHAGR